MTPSQLLPPVKPSEAVAIADLVVQLTQGRAWSTELRARLQSSLPTLKLEKLRALPQTLAPDPAHSSTFYVIVQVDEAHWLLHIAPASAATTPLFPAPILLARVRPSGEREIVVNAIPVAGNLQTIIEGLHPELIARPSSVHQLWSKAAGDGNREFLSQFPKRAGLLPALRSASPGWDFYLDVLLSTWRDGFVAVLEKLTAPPSAEAAAPFSRFSFLVEDPADARGIADFEQRLKSTLHRAFDFEIDLSLHADLDIEELQLLLDNLKLLQCHVQSVELNPQLHVGAFAMALQARQIGLTLVGSGTAELTPGPRMHWKL